MSWTLNKYLFSGRRAICYRYEWGHRSSKEPCCLSLCGLSCFPSFSNHFNFFFFYWSDDVCLSYKEYSKHLITWFLYNVPSRSSRVQGCVQQCPRSILELRIIFDSRVFQVSRSQARVASPDQTIMSKESRRRKPVAWEKGKAKVGGHWELVARSSDGGRWSLGSWGSGAAGRVWPQIRVQTEWNSYTRKQYLSAMFICPEPYPRGEVAAKWIP